MNATDILRNGHFAVLETVDGLAEMDWHTSGVCGVWSTKDIMAHLTSYEQVLVEVLRSLLDDGPTPTLDRFYQEPEHFNDDEVARRQGKSVEAVLAEYKDAYESALALAQRVPEEMWRQNGVLSWYGKAYDLEDFITYTYYGHKREHCAQIAVFRDQLTTTSKQPVASR